MQDIAMNNFDNMDQLLLLAVKCYEAVLDFTNIPDPELTKFATMVRFADLLIDLSKMHNSDAHYERAGGKIYSKREGKEIKREREKNEAKIK